MQKLILPNGLTVIYQRQRGRSAVIEMLVKVGSNHEQENERGLSHFLEHMLFEGTKKHPTNQELANTVESIGGDFNAYTTNERTCFYVKVLNKHFYIAVDVLADILQNSTFGNEQLKKERNVVVKEIGMVLDEPKFYQWVLLQKNLFVKHPARFPTYGKKEVIQSLTREKVVSYFKKHYVPSNMILSIVGDVKEWKKLVHRNFGMMKGPKIKQPLFVEPDGNKHVKEIREKKEVENTYMVLGFKTVSRHHPDSYVLDIINGILGRGQSGKMFTEIRSKLGLAYDVGTQHIAETSFGYFASFATVGRNKLEKVKQMMLKEYKELQKTTAKELEEAKTYIEGDYYLDMEDNQRVADQLLFWEQGKCAEGSTSFIPKIKRVTLADVKRVARTYFHDPLLVVIENKRKKR